MKLYAEINSDNICVGISALSGNVEKTTLIPVKKMDASLIGMKWDGEAWNDVPKEEPDPVEPEETLDPVMVKLETIEAKIQTNEDLQTFYDEIVKEVGL